MKPVMTLLALAGLAACNATPRPPDIASRTPLGEIGVREMVGLTQNEIRAQLGLAPAEGLRASYGMRLINDRRVAIASAADLATTPCATVMEGQRAYTRITPSSAELGFRDGRLGAMMSAPGDPHALAEGGLSASCEVRNVGGSQASGFFLMDLLAAPVTIPLAMAGAFDDSGEWAGLAQLKLGEAAPQPLDQWAATHKARLERTPQGDQQLTFTMDVGQGQPPRAVIRDGRVVEVSIRAPLVRCLLRDDWSLACGLLHHL